MASAGSRSSSIRVTAAANKKTGKEVTSSVVVAANRFGYSNTWGASVKSKPSEILEQRQAGRKAVSDADLILKPSKPPNGRRLLLLSVPQQNSCI